MKGVSVFIPAKSMTEYPRFTAVRSRRRNKTNCQTTCKSKSRSQVRDTSCNTSALLALRGDEPRGGPSRNALLSQASFMSRMEVLYIVWREEGEEEARHALRLMNSFTIEWISCEPNILEIAARLGTFRNTNLAGRALPVKNDTIAQSVSFPAYPVISTYPFPPIGLP